MRRRKQINILKPVRPNAGIAAMYRTKLQRLIAEMNRSVIYWLRARYRANPPMMAQDSLPARDLQKQMEKLGDKWEAQFEAAAPKMAEWFLQSTLTRSDKAMAKILRDGGFSVRWKMTKSMKDVMQATIAEQVNLIKSIPKQYLTQVETLVMESVNAGGDMGRLTKQIEKQFGVTNRRAALIATDQNNKATATLTRVRQLEAGITEAIWMHSHGGREPRPTHLANDGKKFDIAKGWFDPDPKVRAWIWPGQLINCRCVSGAVVKGFS